MSYVLFVVGFLGFFITNIYLIVQAIKKKFRKKLLLPPLICFILCIVGVMLSPTPDKVSVKTIEISIENQKAEYDINQTIPVSISVEPSNADISDLTYISSANKSDTFVFSDSKVETGTNEGSYEIYIKCGDIESNKLSITVVDAAKKAAQVQAKLKAQQEAQEEAQKQAELLSSRLKKKPENKLNFRLSSRLKLNNDKIPHLLPAHRKKNLAALYIGHQMAKCIIPHLIVQVSVVQKQLTVARFHKVASQDHVKIVINANMRDLTTVKSRMFYLSFYLLFSCSR